LHFVFYSRLVNKLKKIIVKKYGGATVATPEKIKGIARSLIAELSAGHTLVVVVSAMGKTTNSLIELASQVSTKPNQREMDMLLSVGERISMSLLSMSIQDLGHQSISLTGSQAGILTNSHHENAQIIDLRPFRVVSELEKNKIIVLAGFQGVDPDTKEITTLGRGGSDTTAVSVASGLKAAVCEILKDVPSVFSADPKKIKSAKVLSELSYEQMMDMTFWGAKVMHYRSVELAAVKGVGLYIGPSEGNHAHQGTYIRTYSNPKGFKVIQETLKNKMETTMILSINTIETVFKIKMKSKSLHDDYARLKDLFKKNEIIFPQILSVDSNGSENTLFITAPDEMLSMIRKMSTGKDMEISEGISTVCLTCTGVPSFETQSQISKILEDLKISPLKIQMSAMSVILFIEKDYLSKTVERLHGLIDQPPVG
jgi:aspartate kinase